MELYQKWDKEIKHKDEIIADNVSYLNCIAPEIINFWKEVSLIYNDYLPYMRAGQYFKLIRSLFQYVNEIKVYLDKVEYIKNEKQYLLKSINCYEDLRSVYSDSKISKKIDICVESWRKQLVTLECEKIDEETILREINNKRNSVSTNSATADMLFMCYKWKSIETEDEKTELEMKIYKIDKSMKRIRRQQLRNKLKKLSPKNLWQELNG